CVGCSIPPFLPPPLLPTPIPATCQFPTEVSALLDRNVKRLWRSGRATQRPEHAKLRRELSLRSRASAGNNCSLQSAIRCLSRNGAPLANFCCASSRRPVGELELPGEQLDGKPEKEPARRLLQAAAPKCVDLARRAPTHETPAGLSASSMPTGPANPAPEPDRPLLPQLPARDLLEELIGDVGPDLLPQTRLASWPPERVLHLSAGWSHGQPGAAGAAGDDAGGCEKAGPDRLLLQLDTGRASVTSLTKTPIHSPIARPGKSGPRPSPPPAGSFASQAADSQPPTAVPFRLTPNLCELISPLGIRGPLQAAIIASARCLVLPKYQLAAYLRCVLRDEVILTYRQANGGACPRPTPSPSQSGRPCRPFWPAYRRWPHSRG
uniref:Rho-GAP domain-containing protein n=1 Tax=Macrostomum lignano TaxID=282301 RepID=A0A1I8F7A9_9PLAT